VAVSKRSPREQKPAAVAAIHLRLREAILRGQLDAGAVLSQVRLAQEYGVSRTPMREALRMLQEEGLVHAEPNRRARVVRFQLDDLEAISAQRIMLSALATYLTVPHMDPDTLAGMSESFERMRKATAANDRDGWRVANLAFHDSHFARTPQLLLQDMRRLQERSALYRSIWLRDEPHLDPQSEVEHGVILDACKTGDAVEAMHGIARHNARVAIAAMTRAVPEREPITIRTALQLALGDGSASPLTSLRTAAGQRRLRRAAP
jgi:DNA-binding GntR family transcriptional regulator